MSKYSAHDDYIDAFCDVLKNRLGIKEQIRLDEIEASLVAARSYELAQNPLQGNFDLPHLKALHRYLFGDVYEWVGKIRTIDLSKGATRFANYLHIESYASSLFQKLADEKHLAGLTVKLFSERSAYYLGEVNALCPFREGNGRVQREFISHLAYKNGCFIDWQHISQQEMVQASIESFNGDCSRFAEYIRQHTKQESI